MKRIVVAVLIIGLIFVVSLPAYSLHRPGRFQGSILGVRPEITIDLDKELIFTSADRVTDLSPGAQTSFLFHNHTDTATAYINSIAISATGQALVDIYDSYTVSDTGTVLNAQNLYLGSDNKTTMMVHKDATVSDTDPNSRILESVIPGGNLGPSRNIGGSLNTRVFVVPPREDFIVILENNGSADANYSINVWWTEKF